MKRENVVNTFRGWVLDHPNYYSRYMNGDDWPAVHRFIDGVC
jgi:hypothetical protein